MQGVKERGKDVELELRGRRETQGSGDEAQGQETESHGSCGLPREHWEHWNPLPF